MVWEKRGYQPSAELHFLQPVGGSASPRWFHPLWYRDATSGRSPKGSCCPSSCWSCAQSYWGACNAPARHRRNSVIPVIRLVWLCSAVFTPKGSGATSSACFQRKRSSCLRRRVCSSPAFFGGAAALRAPVGEPSHYQRTLAKSSQNQDTQAPSDFY